MRKRSLRSDKGKRKSPIHAKVLEMDKDGICIAEIAKHLGVTGSAVVYHLNQEGIHHPRTKKLHAKDLPEAIRLYESGWSCAAVARKFDMTADCLRRRLDIAGIPRRSLKDSVPRGKNNRHYKNGLANTNDKIRNSVPRKESWQVAAICLGHPLASGWVVHHMDENPPNNSADNLWLFPDIHSHARYHAELTDYLQKGIEFDSIQSASKHGALKLPSPPVPILSVHDINPRVLFDKIAERLRDHKEY